MSLGAERLTATKLTQLDPESTPTTFSLSEDTLRGVGIINGEERLGGAFLVSDSGMRSESWIYVIDVSIIGTEGKSRTVTLRQKNLINFGFDLKYKAKRQLEAYSKLQEAGVPVVKLFGATGATIYDEYVPNNDTDWALRMVNEKDSEEADGLLDQLTEIARRIDSINLKPINFVADLIFDGDKGAFLYCDFGDDLGSFAEEDSNHCLTTLQRIFPAQSEKIASMYDAKSIKNANLAV